jgi:hypothetical protein
VTDQFARGTTPQSTKLRNPLPDMRFDDPQVATYVGLIERRLLMLYYMEIRLRAALELATGTPWDTFNLADLEGDNLDNVVAESMVRGLKLTKQEALKRIRANKETANPSQTKSPVPNA